ncbi:serine hydrolase domain-containing protein [Hyphococcus luteus]|uniref:Beta-lactamase-related domain-containing protein n=1 Tax=Hyphococcus luteus TaxID=2058213 RepID=A0A2S7K1J7_9PROT|nr:hypothetical protein CW354_18790 [Marinicaulis flavus]
MDLGAEIIDQASEQFLQQMVVEEHFSGAALVMRGDDIVHARAYGPATLDASNRLDTIFHVASMTKEFTAAAVMQLVEQGMIDLEGSINDYLPERYRSEKWSSVKVRHLLSHTSGVPDYAETRDYYDVVDGWAFGDTVDGMIREAMDKDLQFEPGSDFYYSNIGFTLLGEILQEQSGQPYAAFIQDNVLDPAGMTNSRIHVEGHEPRPGEAAGLRWDEEKGRHVKDDILSLPVTPPDGGLATTLSDFIKWISVYRDMSHPKLSAASLERMMQPSIPPVSYLWPDQGLRGEASYGFGLTLSGDLIMHEGYIVGFRSHFIYSRDDDLLIAVFTNNTSNDVFRMSSGLFAINQ